MTDVDAVTDFLGSLPVPATQAAAALSIAQYSPAELRRAVQSLAQRGYIGCLPFAHDGDSPLFMRLLPAQPPRDCRICVVQDDVGFTFAPSLKHFVAGRLVPLDERRAGVSADAKKMIFDYAAALGSAESARAVFAVRTQAKLHSERYGMLFAAGGKFDPLFEALGAAWLYRKDKLGEWLSTLRPEVRSSDLVDRMIVRRFSRQKDSRQKMYLIAKDVFEPAWRIVLGDHVMDREHLSNSDFSRDAVAAAVNFLWDIPVRDEREKSPLWQAACAAIHTANYGGGAHLDAARVLATDDPVNAYAALANAAWYSARSKKTLLPQILELAVEIASAGKWHELAGTLQLAQGASRKASRASKRAKETHK